MKWYIKAAKKENLEAQNSLGFIFFLGQNVEKNYKEAFKWFSKSAEQGDSYAQYVLGCLYEEGKGVEQSYERARYWYEKAAAEGDGTAFTNLGILYEQGLGVDISPNKAIELWERACKADPKHCEGAQYKLGYAYYDGWGVERDLSKAKEYFELAVKNGYQCSYALEIVKRELGEESKDNLMHEYAESIVKKRIPNDKLYVRISKDLEKDFGSTWQTIDKESKNFLISGLFTYVIYYSVGAQIYAETP